MGKINGKRFYSADAAKKSQGSKYDKLHKADSIRLTFFDISISCLRYSNAEHEYSKNACGDHYCHSREQIKLKIQNKHSIN